MLAVGEIAASCIATHLAEPVAAVCALEVLWEYCMRSHVTKAWVAGCHSRCDKPKVLKGGLWHPPPLTWHASNVYGTSCANTQYMSSVLSARHDCQLRCQQYEPQAQVNSGARSTTACLVSSTLTQVDSSCRFQSGTLPEPLCNANVPRWHWCCVKRMPTLILCKPVTWAAVRAVLWSYPAGDSNPFELAALSYSLALSLPCCQHTLGLRPRKL